jgi:glutamate racemase
MNIGFFDSGLGGLTIMRSVVKAMPDYDYSFYGDTKHVPYGDRPESEVYELTKAGVSYLFDNGAVLVILACNSASAETLRKLQDEFIPREYPGRNLLGVVVPTIEVVVESGVCEVTLIATKRTVQSGKYPRLFEEVAPGSVTVTGLETPELVPFIETGDIAAASAAAIARIDAQGDAPAGIILGCTHYTELKDALRTHYGEGCRIFSQDEIIPTKLAAYLERHPEYSERITNTGQRTIHLTEHRPHYDALMGQFLGGVYREAGE